MPSYRLILIVLSACFAYAPKSHADKVLSSLDSLEWQNRIILVRATADCDSNAQALQGAKPQIDDRDIIWFLLCKTIPEQLFSNFVGSIGPDFSNYLKQGYFKVKKVNVVLIGKDGDVKYQAEQLDLEAINQRVDSMPMRQREMLE